MSSKHDMFESCLQGAFNNEAFIGFTKELFNDISFIAPNKVIPVRNNFSFYVEEYCHIANYVDSEDNKLAIFSVALKAGDTVERARSMQRNFVKKLIEDTSCTGALVAFYTKETLEKWRLSFIRLDYEFSKGTVTEKITPAKRYSYLVGHKEPCHTAKKRLYPIFINDSTNPTLEELENAFSVEPVTKEFFDLYCKKYLDLKEYLERNEEFVAEALNRNFTSEQFAKKLMGQIVFLYFIQKKGWLGVDVFNNILTEKEYSNAFYKQKGKSREILPKLYRHDPDGMYRINVNVLRELSNEDEEIVAHCFAGAPWGSGPKDFMRQIFKGCSARGMNFFNDYLEPLFYTGLNMNRGENGFYAPLHRRIPFLNGGLFEQLEGYDWEHCNFSIPNEIFSNGDGDNADGILDIFDRYNFTMNEDEPLEKEVAIDPEMLGKVFENLLDVKDRKSKGAFYTPREIVHYMCQESLVNYLVNKTGISEKAIRDLILYGEFMRDEDTKKTKFVRGDNGEKGHYEFDYERELYISKEIIDFSSNVNRLEELDNALATVTVADPAVGSGAFPLGMLNEIVKARSVLTEYMTIGMNGYQKLTFIVNGRRLYDLKTQTIKNCIFACDIEPSAVDIAKLRLWLSIVIDDETYLKENLAFDQMTKPRPLPNLDCNIICGNSLVEELNGIKLITESELLCNTVNDSQIDMNQEQVDALIFELIQLQDKLFFVKEHHDKEEIKANIQKIYNAIIEKQLAINPTALKEYYKTIDSQSKPFVLWQLSFAKVFKEKGGFDICIGNPPYIGFHKVPHKEYNKKYYYTADGKYDFYVLFIEKALQLISPKGFMSYICPSYFYKRNYGKKTRELLKENTSIKYIADFSDFQIFDSALTYTCIFGASKVINEDNIINILNEDLNLSAAFEISQKDLTEPSWILERQETNAILEKVQKYSLYTFGEITKSISQGIVTGNNDVYLIDNSTISEKNLEEEYLYVAYKGKDISNGELHNGGYKVFYPYYINEKGKTVCIDEIDLERKAPNLYNYLLEKKDILLSREYFRNSNKSWYELWNPRKKEHFYNRKFVFSEIGLVNDFVLVDECFYTDSVCGAELKDEFKCYEGFIHRYLNTNLATYVYKKVSVPKANGYSIYKNAFLKAMPIILPPENDTLINTDGNNFEDYLYSLIGLTEEEKKMINEMDYITK